MAEKTRRELLMEAWDNEEKDDVAVVESGVGDESDEQPGERQPVGDRFADEQEGDSGQSSPEEVSGRQKTEKPKKEIGKKPPTTEEERQEAEAARRDGDQKQEKPGEAPAAVTDRAPNSWKPATREFWSKIPAEARAEITRREREIQTTLSQTANVRKFAGDFANVINPFSHLIRAQHSTPLQAVHNLMSTAAGLMTGSSQQKASIVAEIIQNYGVDCQELDNVLTAIAQQNGGKVPARSGSAPQEQIPTWAKPLLEQNQRMKQLQEQHEESLKTQADEEIAKIENQPYFEDLRDDVADILQLAAERGRKMTVQQAYEKAIQLNPEISKLVTQQKIASRAQNNGKNITRARRAASSISGAPSGKSAGNKAADGPKTRRQQLSEAWDEAES